MKKRFTPLTALCSAMILSSTISAAEAVVVAEEIPAVEAIASHTEICKDFSSLLKDSLALLESSIGKISSIQIAEDVEQTEEELATAAKVALLTEKLPTIIEQIKSVRANLKVISPDSWTEWIVKQVTSSNVQTEQEDDIIAATVPPLQVVDIVINDFMENFEAIKEASDKEEALQAIEKSLGSIKADIREIKVAVAPKATITSMATSLIAALANALTLN